MSGVSADLTLDASAAESTVDELDARLSEVTANFAASLADAISSVSGPAIEVPVEVDTAGAEAQLEALDQAPVEIEVQADTSEAEAAVSGLGDAGVEASQGLGQAAQQTEQLSEAAGGAGVNAAGLGLGLGRLGSASGVAVLGVAGLAAGAVSMVQAFSEAEGVVTITESLIRSQGDAAFTTADQVASLAERVMEYSGFSDEAVLSGVNFLLQLGNIRNEAGRGNNVFDRAVEASADLARALGTDVSAAATGLGRALSSPETGLSRLERRLGRFPEAQREMILSLAESGDLLGAQSALLDVLDSKIGQVSEDYGSELPGALDRAEESVGELAEAIGEELAPGVTEFAELVAAITGPLDDLKGGMERVGAIGFDRLFANSGVDDFVDSLQSFGDFGSQLGFSEEQMARFLAFDAVGETLEVANEIIAASADEAAGALGDEATSAEELSAAVATLTEELDAAFGAQQTVDEGAISIRESQRELFAQLLEMGGAYRAQTESGDEFLGTARQLAGGIRDQTLALLDSGAGAEVASRAQEQYIAGLRQTLRAAGLTEREINDLIRTYGRVPEEEITEFRTPGAPESRRSAQEVDRAIRNIPSQKNSIIHVDNTSALYNIQQVIDAFDRVDANRAAALQDISGGPEAFTPRTRQGAVVVGGPSGQSGRPPVVVQVDARGSSDPAAVERGARRGVEAAAARLAAVDIRLGV